MEYYENLNIYELREIARKKGVKCPTNKNRNYLIKEMLKIDNNEQEPYVNKTKQGRPVKNANSYLLKSKSINSKIGLEIITKQKLFFENLKIYNINMGFLIDEMLNKINEILK